MSEAIGLPLIAMTKLALISLVKARNDRIAELELKLARCRLIINTDEGVAAVYSDNRKFEAKLAEIGGLIKPLTQWFDSKQFDSALEKLEAILGDK